MTTATVGTRRPVKPAARFFVVVFAAALTGMNLWAFVGEAIHVLVGQASFSRWAFVWIGLALAPAVAVFRRWRWTQSDEALSAEALWHCSLSLLSVGLATLPFALLIIAVR